MPQRVHVACGVAVAGLEDDLVGRGGAERRVFVHELMSVDPAHEPVGLRRQAEPGLNRDLVDVVVERDANGRGGGHVEGVPLR